MEELKRQKRVLKMLITMHSVLRDRLSRIALITDIILLVSAILLNALVFIDFKYLQPLFKIELYSEIVIGIFALIVFTSSMITLLVRWKQKAEAHNRAAIQLNVLLNECRIIIEHDEVNKENLVEFSKKYSQITGSIIQIQDNHFAKLKSLHYQKIRLSKMISKNPGIPIIILRIIIFFKSIRNYKDD